MLHLLASTYFVLLAGLAVAVIAGMLLLERDLILQALGLREEPTIAPLPTLRERPAPRARVIRTAPALKLAA